MKYNPRIVTAYFEECKLPPPVLEWQFDAVRKWRFDFSWLPQRVALECQGGNWAGGRHTRPAALRKEYEKLNAAAAQGWRILYVFPEDLCMAETVEMIRTCLA